MAHLLYETGGMRRVHLKGRDNLLKRLLVHDGAFNLALVMRQLIGVGKPRALQGISAQTLANFGGILATIWKALQIGNELIAIGREPVTYLRRETLFSYPHSCRFGTHAFGQNLTSTTGC